MNKPHIYKVTNTVNGKLYVGQHDGSKASYFAGGKAIKQAIKKHGKAAFTRDVVVSGDFSKEELDELEIHYIAHFKSYMPDYPSNGYNLTLGGGGKRGDVASERTKMLRSVNSANQRAVVQFGLDGNKLAYYRTVLEASAALGLAHSTIYRACSGEARQAAGFLWLFASDYDSSKRPCLAANKTFKEVAQYDLNNRLIALYPTAVNAAAVNGFNRSGIANALAGTRPTSNGFRWKYATTSSH